MKKLSLKLCLFLLILLMLPASVQAQGIAPQSTVKEGEVINRSLVLSGPVVLMDGVINGDLVAVGKKITINGEVNGSLIVAGANVVLNGSVTGSTYVAAELLTLGPQADLGQDLYFTGYGIETQQGSMVSRNLNALSVEMSLQEGSYENVNAVVGARNLAIGLYSLIKGEEWQPRIFQPQSQIFPGGLEKQAAAGAAFGVTAGKNILLLSNPIAESEYSNVLQQTPAETEALRDWAVSFLRNLAALIILGLLVVWLVPAQLVWTSEQARISPWRSLFDGLLVFTFGWIIAILAIVLVVVLTIFLYWISLPYLAFMVGMLGLLSVGLAISVFWVSIVFLSKLVVAYLVGSLLIKRFIPKYAQSRVLPLIVGVVLYALLASIPYLGWLVVVIATLVGLGAIWKFTTYWRAEKETVPSAQPVEDISPLNLVSEG